MRREMTLALLAAGGALPSAQAQEWTVEARATIAAAAIEDDSELTPAGDGLLADAGLVVARTDVFENGLSLTWRGEARLQRDASSRPAFAGVLGGCDASTPACPRVATPGGFRSPVSPATGLAVGLRPVDKDVFATVESASVALSGAWGEGVFGLDSGAAARLDARPPTVLERVSATSPGLDPTGLVTTRARNDVTGPSAKATYLSPRWLGFRAGASFTPEANLRGADFDPDFSAPGVAGAELESVWEGGLSFARQFAREGVRVRAAVTLTRAKSGAGLVEFGDYEAWGAGLELEQGAWTAGLRWLGSDNAWRDAGVNGVDGDYEAWEFGLVRQGETWRIGAELGQSRDDLTGVEGLSWLVGASRQIGESLRLGAAWTSAEADLAVSVGSANGHRNASNGGFVVELTVGNW